MQHVVMRRPGILGETKVHGELNEGPNTMIDELKPELKPMHNQLYSTQSDKRHCVARATSYLERLLEIESIILAVKILVGDAMIER